MNNIQCCNCGYIFKAGELMVNGSIIGLEFYCINCKKAKCTPEKPNFTRIKQAALNNQ